VKLKLGPIFKDISLTYVTEAIVMVAFFETVAEPPDWSAPYSLTWEEQVVYFIQNYALPPLTDAPVNPVENALIAIAQGWRD
jgi:hypothetical protein